MGPYSQDILLKSIICFVKVTLNIPGKEEMLSSLKVHGTAFSYDS